MFSNGTHGFKGVLWDVAIFSLRILEQYIQYSLLSIVRKSALLCPLLSGLPHLHRPDRAADPEPRALCRQYLFFCDERRLIRKSAQKLKKSRC